MSILFPFLPYFWLLLFVGAVFSVIVAAMRARPKKPKVEKPAKAKKEKKKKGKKKKGEPEEEATEDQPELDGGEFADFEDELTQAQPR